jgi:hypothetical protein
LNLDGPKPNQNVCGGSFISDDIGRIESRKRSRHAYLIPRLIVGQPECDRSAKHARNEKIDVGVGFPLCPNAGAGGLISAPPAIDIQRGGAERKR